jgi:hypothetical protein
VTFAAPLALVALAALPLLWWLLRVTPPSPRREIFPAIRLLLGLNPTEETPARTPWWLLLLRLVAAALVIIALARPVLDSSGSIAGKGPVLLVIDNGWAAAAEWPRRMQMANTVLDRASRAGRRVGLLVTAPGENGAILKATAPMPVSDIRALVGALRPEAWPSNRAAAGTDVVYIADGLLDGSDFPAFEKGLAAIGKVTEICCAPTGPKLLLPPETEADRMVVHVARASTASPETSAVLARSGDGRTLARAEIQLPKGVATGTASLTLPLELRNRISRAVGRTVAAAAGWPADHGSDLGRRAPDRPVVLSAPRPRTVRRVAGRRSADAAARRDFSPSAGRSQFDRGAGTHRADRLGREGRPVDPLRRPASRGGHDARPAAAGPSAERGPSTRGHHVLE